MDATRGRQRLNFSLPIAALLGGKGGRLALPVAPTFAGLLAALAGLMFLIMPTGVLEDLSVDSGVASLITAAEPPLGITARLAIVFIVALVVGGVSWFGLFLLVGTRAIVVSRGKREDGVPVLRRADAHPDAPARRPVFAHRDLGTPFLDVKADPLDAPMPVADAIAFAPPVVFEERDIPKNLDTPLATYLHPLDPPLPAPEPAPAPEPLPILRAPDPVAPPPIAPEPPVPEPVVAVDPRPVFEPEPAPAPEPRFAAHERIETFELTPMVRPPAGETSAPLAPATIHDLLERLERGVAKRQTVASPAPEAADPESPEPGSLEETLGVLRRLASRVG